MDDNDSSMKSGALSSGSDLTTMSDNSITTTDLNHIIIKEPKKIDDVVSFSLCSLCAIKLEYLYPEDHHRPFKKQSLERMVKYLNLPDKVKKTITEFIIDDEFTFLMSIKQNHDGGLFKLIETLILISIEGGSYDARSHQLVIDVAEMLGVPRDLVELHCESIYDLLSNNGKAKRKSYGTKTDTGSDDEIITKEDDGQNGDYNNGRSGTTTSEHVTNYDDKTKNNENKKLKKKSVDEATMRKVKKYMIVGLASLGGAAVMGVTGGLAAPVVASALAGVVGGSLVLSTTAAGVVGSLFGVAGAGLTASKMNKRIGELEEFSFLSLNPAYDQTSLTITIAISGWISEDNERGFIKPWRRLRHTREQYCLCYEPKYLLELSQAMDYLLSLFFSYAAQQALTYTFLASVMAAIAWPAALMSMANIIDNPWDVCINRAAKAGKRLGELLRSRQQGNRPVTLIGFSLGARVIFYCLQELAQHIKTDTLGLIADVIILGAPVTASEEQWRSIGQVVSGKIINGYSSSDWLLKFLYRTSNAAIKIAGLQEIPLKDKRLRNVNLTPLVGGHLDYYKKINEILEYINIKIADPDDLDDDDLTLSLTTSTFSDAGAKSTNNSNDLAKCPRAKWDSNGPEAFASSFIKQLNGLTLDNTSAGKQKISVESGKMIFVEQSANNEQQPICQNNNSGAFKMKKKPFGLRRAKSLNLRISHQYKNSITKQTQDNLNRSINIATKSSVALNGSKRPPTNSWAVQRIARRTSWSFESI